MPSGDEAIADPPVGGKDCLFYINGAFAHDVKGFEQINGHEWGKKRGKKLPGM